MCVVHGKGRNADGDIFRSFIFGSAVLNPFAWMSNDGLARVDIDDSITMSDSDGSFQNEREFFEGGCLTRLNPTSRAL